MKPDVTYQISTNSLLELFLASTETDPYCYNHYHYLRQKTSTADDDYVLHCLIPSH